MQYVPNLIRFLIELSPALAERLQVGIQIAGKELLALHTANPCPPAFHIYLGNLLGGGKDLVHGKDVADIRVARVGTAHSLRISHHLHDPLGGLFRGQSQLDVVVQALTHLCLTIDPQHLGDFSSLHARLN